MSSIIQPRTSARASGRALVRSESGGGKLRLLTIAGIANLSMFYSGMILGWTSPTLPKLSKPGPDNPLDMPLTSIQVAWIGSIVALGAAIGPFPGGALADRCGRRGAILLSTLPSLIGWLMIALAKNAELIYAARFLFGLGIGCAFTVVPMYTGEIAEDSVRGALGSFLQLFIVTGFLAAYAIGPYVSYIGLVAASVVPVILFVIIFFFMPETPYYYLAKSRREDALKALSFLRGRSVQDVQPELDKIEVAVAEANAGSSRGQIKELIKTPGSMKALGIAFALVTAQQLAGINVVLFYTETIFSKTGNTMEPEQAAILLGVVQILASAVTPLLVDRVGRKMMLIISGVGLTISLTALGIYFKLDDLEYEGIQTLGWLPITCLISYIIVFCFGFGPLPWAVMGEIFSPNIKATASALTASFCWVLTFVVTKYFEALSEKIGIDVVFWLFAGCCAAAALFVLVYVPETKGLSLHEIQLRMAGQSSLRHEENGATGLTRSTSKTEIY